MEFRILGPLEVVRHGEPIDIGPPKQRELLALLLINANRVVTTQRILEDLWGDDSTGKENALWVYVSRLRSALEPERPARESSTVLVTRDHGYVLSVAPESLDAHVFQTAVEVARPSVRDDPSAASERLAAALELWRGEALEDFVYRDFAQLEIARLEALRLDAVEARIEADLRRGLSGELVSELEALHSQHPVREGFVAQLMLALYQAGRQADSLRVFDRFRRSLGEELGLEPSPELRRLEEEVLLHDSRIRNRIPEVGRVGTRVRAERNPYKGLRAFTEEDSNEFFGRDRLVSEVLRRIRAESRLIALVGASGSGKSSLLRAGVVPAVLKGGLGDSEQENWTVARMVPGAKPFAELEVALLRSTLDAPASLSQQLADPVSGALRAALRVLPRSDSRMLLVIDQFEELFTLSDEQERNRFISSLIPIVDDPHRRITIVLALRSDFYEGPLDFPEFGSRLGDAIVNVVAQSPDELEEAAQRPAEAAGTACSPALLGALLTDVIGRPGSLPLFQYALTELFERRTGDTLELADYQAMGGLSGMLSRRADDLYESMQPKEQEAAKQLLLRLVTISDEDEWSRRRVAASEIASLDVDLVAVQHVVEVFAEHRLLTIDRDALSGSPTVEVAHEALLTEWGLLRGWIDRSREDVRRSALLTAAMAEWVENDRNPDFLLTGARLRGYLDWADGSAIQLTSDQRAFIEKSTSTSEQLELAAAAHSTRISKTERVARRRLWVLVAGVVLAAGFGIWFLAFGRPAEPITVAVVAPSILPYERSLVGTGVARAERELPVTIDFRQRVSNLEEEYRGLADAGTDLIFIDPGNSGWPYVFQVIADYPDTAFAVVDPIVPPPGAQTTFLADEEAAYLAGVAAALTSETGVVGFVGAKHLDVTDKWRAGFEAGAIAVEPRVTVLATHISTDSSGFSDIEGGREAASLLFGRDADVVLALAEDANLGVIQAAFETSQRGGVKRWAIGSGSDWSNEVPSHLRAHLLTSALKKWDFAMFEVIRRFTDGEFEPGISVLRFADGAVGLADSAFLSSQSLERVESYATDLIDDGVAIPRLPGGELLPPPRLMVSHEVAVTWDGENCVYEGPLGEFPAGGGLRIEFINQTNVYRGNWAVYGPQSDLAVSTMVGPMSSTVAYASLKTGTLEINCGPDLAIHPPDPAKAAVLTIG